MRYMHIKTVKGLCYPSKPYILIALCRKGFGGTGRNPEEDMAKWKESQFSETFGEEFSTEMPGLIIEEREGLRILRVKHG